MEKFVKGIITVMVMKKVITGDEKGKGIEGNQGMSKQR